MASSDGFSLQNELVSILDIILDDGDGDVLNPCSPDVSLRQIHSGYMNSILIEVVGSEEGIMERWALEARNMEGCDTSVLSNTMKKRIVTLKRTLFALICSHRRITNDISGDNMIKVGLYSYRVVEGPAVQLDLNPSETHTLSTMSPSEVVISVTATFLIDPELIPESMRNPPVDLLLPLSPFEECLVLAKGQEESGVAELMEHRFFKRNYCTSVKSLSNSSTILAMKHRQRERGLSHRISALAYFLNEFPFPEGQRAV